jgi:ribosomal protein L15E
MKTQNVLISVENIQIMIEMLTNYMILYLNDPNYDEKQLKLIFKQKQQLIIKLERVNAREAFDTDKEKYTEVMAHVSNLVKGINQ